MTNTFQTLQEDYLYKGYSSEELIPKGTIYFQTNYGTCRHASAKGSQCLPFQANYVKDKMVLAPSTDWELLKIWHHATVERKHSVYASKALLRVELESRGYNLTEDGHHWKKVEVAA